MLCLGSQSLYLPVYLSIYQVESSYSFQVTTSRVTINVNAADPIGSRSHFELPGERKRVPMEAEHAWERGECPWEADSNDGWL